MNPTPKQIRQRKLYVALGTVKGFNGYLLNLKAVIERTDIDVVTKYYFERDLQALQIQLSIAEEKLRASLKRGAPK